MNHNVILLVAGIPAYFASNGLPDLDGSWLLQALVFISCALVIWNQGAAAFGKGKGKSFPKPLIVEQLKSMATREEVEALEEKMEREFRAQSTASLSSASKTHRRIDNQSTKLDTLIGEVRGIKSTNDLLLSNKINTATKP